MNGNRMMCIVLLVVAAVLVVVGSVMAGWGSGSVVQAAPRGRMEIVSTEGWPSEMRFTIIRDAITGKEYLIASFRGSTAIAVCPMVDALKIGQPE